MPNKKWYWNDIMDGLLRRLYDPTVRGRSQEIAARLKVPRWAVNRRAAALGLSRPKDRPWTAEDESYRGRQVSDTNRSPAGGSIPNAT